MATRVDYDKYKALKRLNLGDVIRLTDGTVVEFVRLKQKRFIGRTADGKSYDISINMFSEFLEESKKDKDSIISSLNPGELFYIQANNGDAILYEFEEDRGDIIIGKNVISHVRTRIYKELFVDKVDNLSA